MLKRKTATLDVYTPWGNPSARSVDVRYRGKLLYNFFGDTELELLNKARIWSVNQGFTRVRYQYVVGA